MPADTDAPELLPSRWYFWTHEAPRTFCYASAKSPAKRRADHIAVTSYNPLTDMVKVRIGNFGYVYDERSMTRAEYWHERKQYHPDDRRQPKAKTKPVWEQLS